MLVFRSILDLCIMPDVFWYYPRTAPESSMWILNMDVLRLSNIREFLSGYDGTSTFEMWDDSDIISVDL